MFNIDNCKYFNQPEEADNWVWRIKNGIGDWIKKHNKSFWYIVLWESKRAGILKDNTTRNDFARLLVEECSEALAEGDTIDKIVHSMEKYKYKWHLKDFDKQPDLSFIRKDVNELSNLLTCDIPKDTRNTVFTLEQRMQEYLTASTANETYARVCIRPVYNGKTATMSVENYVSKKFWNMNRPSRTVIFECVDEKLTEEKVEMLHGRFCSLRNIKLFIASTHAFSGNVKREAESFDIGLILVNLDYEVSENSFVLPRTQGSRHSEEFSWYRMLEGKENMTVSVLAYDSGRIDDSFSFILYKYALCDKKNLFVAAPYLSDAEIADVALQLVMPQVDFYVSMLRQCGPHDKVPACVIDPYILAEKMGLTVDRGKTGKKLGHIDIGHKKVTLSNQLDYDDPSDRFSMAHEIGHNIFHRRVSEKAEDGVHAIVSYNRRWLEHHANYFASCLLMPASVIRMLYDIYWKKEFKTEKVDSIYVKEDYYNDPIFQRVVCPVARKMGVSPNAAYIRLKKMKLIIEKS